VGVTSSRQDLRRAIQALAFVQAGFFTAAQAVETGYSYQAQKHHVDTGNWVRVDRGIFRLPDWPQDADDTYVRWTLWSRGRGVISHNSALRIHGLSDADPAKIHMSAPPGFRTRDDQVILYSVLVPDEDRDVRRGWSVTTPLRTLVDVADGDASQETVDDAVADALAGGLVTRRSVLRRAVQEADRAALRLERALAKAVANA